MLLLPVKFELAIQKSEEDILIEDVLRDTIDDLSEEEKEII